MGNLGDQRSDSGLSDDDLMRLSGDGQKEAFGALFARHHAEVYHFARMMLRSPEAAQDVLQETFLSALRTAGRYSGDGRFRPWLLRIARNLCLNRLSAERARRAVMAGMAQADTTGPTQVAPDPADAVQLADQSQRLLAAMATLPERQREALALHALREMALQEVAQAMDTPLNTVKTLVRRARLALAARLGGTGDDGCRRT